MTSFQELRELAKNLPNLSEFLSDGGFGGEKTLGFELRDAVLILR
jgi:hypothetical protein